MRRFMHIIWTVAKKDFKTWFRDPTFLVASILVPLVLLAVFSLVGFSSASIPIALSSNDTTNSEQVTKVIKELKSPVSPFFEVTTQNSQNANEEWENGSVLGMVKYPGNEETQYFNLYFFNINGDYTKNYLLRFAKVSRELSEANLPSGHAIVSTEEKALLPKDTAIWKYIAVGLVGFSIVFSGIVNSGVMVAREWKELTIKELILSPENRFSIFGGKVLAGLMAGGINAVIMLLAIYIFYGIYPIGSWLLLILVLFFSSVLSIGVGIILGLILKRLDIMAPIGMIIVTVLWLICGGLGPRGQLPDSLWYVSKYLPFTYTFEPLHMIMETNSTIGMSADLLTIGTSSFIAIICAIYLLNRSTTK